MGLPKISDVMAGKSPKASLLDPSGGFGDEPDGDEPDDDDGPPSPEEVDAMRLFEASKSPEDKAAALKKFLKLCGASY